MNFFKAKHKKEYVAAILLRHGDGQGYLLEVVEATKSITLIDQRAFNFTNGWDNLTYDVDELLFNLENDHKIELKKAAFFVYSHLIDLDTRDITSPYKEHLEKIIQDNELASLGYLEMDQIISKHLASQEGSPLSATVIEIDTPAVSVFVYQAGELVFSESVARSENIVADLTELFQHTQKDTILPTRLVMYDSQGLEDEAAKIIAHKWPKEVFMHVPKVEIINEMDFTNAIVHVSPEYIFPNSGKGEADVPLTMAGPSMSNSDEADVVAADMVPEDLGFVIGADVKKSNLPQPVGTDVYESPMQGESPIVTNSLFSKVKSYIPSLSMPSMSFFSSSRKKPIIIGTIAVMILLIGAAAGLYYAHTATLTVYFETSEISEEVDFDQADFIEEKAEEIETEASIKTTGTKKVGEKATGEVTIFNATESDKTFNKGTKLIAPNKLVFVLDNDVTVKAATKTVTGDGDILTTTSKENADVVAEDIGTDYNLAKDTKFTFEGSSDTTYFARASNALTGGTEKEIQTASKEDFTRIEAEIQKQINQKKADALQQGEGTQKVLGELTEIELVEEEYSKEVAEEAESLDAKVTAEVTYYLYDESVVKKALSEALFDKIPENYELKPENVTFTVSSSEKTDDGISLTLEAKGEPTYKIDNAKLISLIKGKSTSSIEKILKENTDTTGYAVDVVSPIPFFKFFTPLFDKNYKIVSEPL